MDTLQTFKSKVKLKPSFQRRARSAAIANNVGNPGRSRQGGQMPTEMPSLSRGDVIYCVWEDSAHLPNWQYPPFALELGEIRSAGILISVTESEIVITPAMNDENAALTPLAIPVSCIKKIKKIEI
jgi:hypothetical protein